MSENLPKGWIEIQIEDIIISLESGSRPKGGVKGIESGIPSIGGEHVNNIGGFNFDKIRFIPFAYYESIRKGHIEINDILIVKDGATTGKTSYVESSFPYKKAVVNEHVFILKTSKIIISKLIFYFLWSEKGKANILANFQGSAQGGINRQFITNTLIPFPPLNEQKRIVAKLDQILPRINSVRERLDKIPAIIKRFRQSVLTAAVTGKLTEKWRETHPDIESAKEMIIDISRKRKIEYERNILLYKQNKAKKPEINYDFIFDNDENIDSWITAKLDKLVYISARIGWKGLKAEEYTESGPYFLSVHSLNYGEEVDFRKAFHISKERYEESPEIKIKENDILLCKDGAGIGKLGIVNKLPGKATVNSSLLVIRGLEAFLPKFLFYFFRGPKLQAIVQDRITGTATPHLFQKDIKEFYLPIPPLEEQKEIVRQVDRFFALADRFESHYEKAKARVDKISQSVLAKAFRGELVITEAELAKKEGRDYESAEELLERIKEEKEERELKIKMELKIKKSKEGKMKYETKRKSLLEIIKDNNNGITPENLFKESGYLSSEINKFYMELKAISNEIEELRSDEKIGKWPDRKSIFLKPKIR